MIDSATCISVLLSNLAIAGAPAQADVNAQDGADWRRIRFNNPGLVVDLGVGLWARPMPMDYDKDGDYDLVVSCKDKPYNGTYIFENPGNGEQPGSSDKMPVFKPGVRIGPGIGEVEVSYWQGEPHVLSPNQAYLNFRDHQYDQTKSLGLSTNIHENKVRANQWKYADYDGDDDPDLIIGVGDWTDYGWDNAFDAQGNWTRGPLHGYVYLAENTGDADNPTFAKPVKLTADGKPIDVYGMPSPNFADFDGDGDLDLVCGEFVDSFTYFQNTGTREQPEYIPGVRLKSGDKDLKVDACMMDVDAIDWDRDGDTDLVVGQEDGRVMLFEHTGVVVDGVPQFVGPVYFQQEAEYLKFGVLVTPVSYDWDGDGDEDLITGNAAGWIGFIENLGGDPIKWAAPQRLKAGGEVIDIQAGYNGSIQGPCEAKWGYTTLSVADWDGDGLADLIVNSIWGKVIWFRNVGTRQMPVLAAAESVRVAWEDGPTKPAWNWWTPKNNELSTQWRTTPVAYDWNRDGLCDLVMLDHEGYLSFYQRQRTEEGLVLLPPERIFYLEGPSGFDSRHRVSEETAGSIRLNTRDAGKSGRRKLCIIDLNNDGLDDIIVNSASANLLKQIESTVGRAVFIDHGQLKGRDLAGHTTSPTTVDWDGDGVRDPLIGAEDGFFYHQPNPYISD